MKRDLEVMLGIKEPPPSKAFVLRLWWQSLHVKFQALILMGACIFAGLCLGGIICLILGK